MKVAVLGSSGFLGSYIVKNLKGVDVYPISRKTLNINNFNHVQEWLEYIKPDVIINCATAGGKTKMGEVSLDDFQNNLSLFLNFYNNSDLFSKFINIGSGAEFDVSTDINKATEDSILTANPKETYGYSKNLIARMCLEKQNFYTLRLFGCFDTSEPDFRLFKRFLRNDPLDLVDRQFDFFSAQDFFRVLTYYLNNEVEQRDINCVYENKLYLSEILGKFRPVEITKKIDKNYTGDGSKLAKLGIPLVGLDESIKDYK